MNRRSRAIGRSRWVSPELSELKAAADLAGVAVREAQRRCFASNVQYLWHLHLSRLKPLKMAGWAPNPEQVARAEAKSLAKVEHWDNERKAARLELDNVRVRLSEELAAYREAKQRRPGTHES